MNLRQMASELPVAIVLTALSTDYQAVRAHLEELREEVHQGTVYERGYFHAPGQIWLVGIVQVGQSNISVAIETERMIRYFQPGLAFFVGTAGGIKDVRLGDVVVAEKVYNYEAGKAAEWSLFLAQPQVENPDYALFGRARAEASRSDWLSRIKNRRTGTTPPQVLLKPIASGEKLVVSTFAPLLRLLKWHFEDALAIEREGHGFLKTAQANAPVKALVVRGISNMLDDKRQADAEQWQVIAAQHASAFAFEVLAKIAAQRSPAPPARRASSIFARARIMEEYGASLLDITLQNRTEENILVLGVNIEIADAQIFSSCLEDNDADGKRAYIDISTRYRMVLTPKLVGQTKSLNISHALAPEDVDRFQIVLEPDEYEQERHPSVWYYLKIALICGEKQIVLNPLLCAAAPIDRTTKHNVWFIEEGACTWRNREMALRLAALPAARSETVDDVIRSIQAQE